MSFFASQKEWQFYKRYFLLREMQIHFFLVHLHPAFPNRQRNGGNKNLITESAPTHAICLGIRCPQYHTHL